jgi:branched-chain amino acid aminotransferase
MNSQLVRMEAVRHGYEEGITLDSYGNISEGSGENIFIVVNNTLYTPPAGSSILPGITRASVMQMARDAGMAVMEQTIPRAMLYTCDEMFMTGTAVEITPVRSVDRVQIGNGFTGPMTKTIMQAFANVVEKGEDPHSWLTFI